MSSLNLCSPTASSAGGRRNGGSRGRIKRGKPAMPSTALSEPALPALDELGRDLTVTTPRERRLALARPFLGLAAYALAAYAGVWWLTPWIVFLIFVAVVTVTHDVVHNSLGLRLASNRLGSVCNGGRAARKRPRLSPQRTPAASSGSFRARTTLRATRSADGILACRPLRADFPAETLAVGLPQEPAGQCRSGAGCWSRRPGNSDCDRGGMLRSFRSLRPCWFMWPSPSAGAGSIRY